MSSIPLTCPACNGTGGAQITWSSDGTSLTPPPWVEEQMRNNRCATCAGTGYVYYLYTPTPEHLPLQSDVLAKLLDVREVSGCAECPLGTSTNDCIEGIDFPLWQCGHDGEPRQGQAPTVAPDWCPLRKGPVTLKLKEGA